MITNKQKKKLSRWVLNITFLAVLGYFVYDWASARSPRYEAPELSGSGLDESFESIEFVSSGKPTLVYFWRPWCTVCKLVNGNVQELSRTHNVMTVVSEADDAAEIKQHMLDEGLDFRVIYDRSGEVATRWRVGGTPAFYIIDKDAMVRSASTGYVPKLVLEHRIEQAAKPY